MKVPAKELRSDDHFGRSADEMTAGSCASKDQTALAALASLGRFWACVTDLGHDLTSGSHVVM